MSWPKIIRSKLVSRFAMSFAVAAAMLAPQAQSQTPSAPRTENAKLEQRAVAGNFAQTIEAWAKSADHAQWLAYSVPAVSGDPESDFANGRLCCASLWHMDAFHSLHHGGDFNGLPWSPVRVAQGK
jgi:hypothetical protein